MSLYQRIVFGEWLRSSWWRRYSLIAFSAQDVLSI